MSKNRTLADFISTSSVSAEEIANGAVTVVKLANTTSSNGTSLIQMSGHSTALNITPSGRIGIDTNDPNQKLHVHDSSTNATHIRTTNSNGDIFYGIDGNGAGYAWMNSGAGDFYVGTNGAGNLIAYAGSAERMRITSSGHVGIGTTSPSGDLSLQSNNPNIRFDDSDTSNNGEITLDNTALRIEADEDNAVANSLLTFRIDGSEKMRITSGGNVGIGTSSPSQKLDVNGTIVASTTASQGARIERNGTTGGANFDSVLASGSLHFRTGSTERMRIHSGGQVSIASTEATHGLNVGTSGTDFRGRFQGNNPYRLGLQNGTNNLVWLGSPGSNAFRISNAAGSAIFDIDGSGNVGIGTTSPEQELDVAGQILIQPTGVTSGTTDTARKLGFRGVNSTYSEYVEDFVQTNNNQQTSGTTSHWFAIKSYSRYQASSSQGGMMNIKIIKNADHATMCHYYEYMLFQGTGSGGNNSNTSTTIVQLWDVAAKQLGWNYYSLTVTPTFYRPNAGLTITNYYEERYPLLLKVEVSGNSNYNREIGVAVSGYMGRLYRLSGEALEYLGSSTPSDFTGNYATINSSGAWL